MDDSRIVEFFLLRDETVVKASSEKYGNRLRALSYAIVRDMQTAEECENDTYMEAWNAIPPHEPRTYLFAFLARIARHLSLNSCRDCSRLKRSAFLCELNAELEQCIPAPDDAQCRIDDIAFQEMLNAFLGTLNEILSMTVLTEEDYTPYASSTAPTEIHAKTDNGELHVRTDGNIVYMLPDDGLAAAEKIGDYPIITAEEATERLISGQYQTSAPAEFPGEEFIGKVELVYRSGSSDEMLLPYYRFYVLLSDEYVPDTDNGLKTYAAYYVPAITDEYIAGMTTYDGWFSG